MADRYYTAEDMGPVCRRCGLKVPRKLATDVHPCCAGEDQ